MFIYKTFDYLLNHLSYIYKENNYIKMIKLYSLISEKFEIPAALQKQLENTAYSAIGHVIPPYLEKFKKKIFLNKGLNEKSFQSLKNIFSNIRMLTQSSGNNTKLTFTDVLVPEYYSVTITKDIIKKVNVTVEKTGDDIYVESDEKKDRLFPHMIVSRDYAGWDLKRFNEEWHRFEESYQVWEKEFDEKIVLLEQVKNKLENWKTLDKPKKPKIHPDGQQMSLVYEKQFDWDGKPRQYDHYFRVLPSYKAETYQSPNHFVGSTRPYIVQTIYLDQFSGESYTVDSFLESAYKMISTAKHEGRHLIQHYGQISKGLKGDYYGGPKSQFRHTFNPDVRGTDPQGAAGPTAKYKEPEDRFRRVLHPHRDVEFKTNLYDYKEAIKSFLSNNLPKEKWKIGFNDLMKYVAGFYNYSGFRQKYPHGYQWEYSIAKRDLEELFKHDRPKFNQFVKELYKLLFNV